MKTTAYLSLGSNLGDREANLRDAIVRLRTLGEFVAVSGFYETEPIEVTAQQPWFLNCVVGLETELMPEQVLAQALAIEQAMGRRRTGNRAPREIDIDIVLFGNTIMNAPGLTIPHPAMQRRRFVLLPLAEIAPEARHPVLNRTVSELLADLPAAAGSVRKFDSGGSQ